MQWINCCCMVMNLEMQVNRCCICVFYSGDFLFSFYVLFIIYQYCVIMGVSCNVIFIVFNYDEIIVVMQLVVYIYYFFCICGVNRCILWS